MIIMRTYRQVCTCEKQPCLLCFALYDLYLREIEWMLDE